MFTFKVSTIVKKMLGTVKIIHKFLKFEIKLAKQTKCFHQTVKTVKIEEKF